MVHAALLLLMLEAVTKDLVFTISLKRSTQNLQLSTSWPGRLHHLRLLPAGAIAGWGLHPLESAALSRRTPRTDICGERLIKPRARYSGIFRPGSSSGRFRQLATAPRKEPATRPSRSRWRRVARR